MAMTAADPLAWQDDASCKDVNPDLFFPNPGDLYASRLAKKVCAVCPVKAECLNHALVNVERWGVWGGTTPKERRRIRLGVRRIA